MQKNTDNEKTNDLLLEQKADAARGTILGVRGQDGDGNEIVLNLNPDEASGSKNVMVFGGTGSGKTTCFSYNYILQAMRRRESVVVVETEGACKDLFWDFAEKQGYVQKCLNLRNLEQSDGWNPIESCIGKKTSTEDARVLATLLLSKLDGKDISSDIFSRGRVALLKALLLRIACGNDFDTRLWADAPLHIDELPLTRYELGWSGLIGPKTMESLYALIMHPDGLVFLETFFEKDVLERTKAMDAFRPFLSFKEESPNLLGNLVSQLSIQLQIMMSKDIYELLSRNDIDLELPGKRPCIYYCEIPSTYEKHNYIAALFIDMLYYKVSQLAEMQYDRKTPVPVNFLLEDFANLGYMPDWGAKCALANGKDINISMVMSDALQLNEVYDKAQSECIMNNCGAMLSFASQTSDVDDLLSATLGKSSFAEKIVSQGKRPFVNSDDLSCATQDDVVLLMHDQQPMTLKKFHYTQNPLYKSMLQVENVRESEDEGTFEIAKVVSIDEADGPIFGIADRDARQKPYVLTQNMDAPYGNQNVLVLGNEASGKTTAYNMNDLLQTIRRNESAVIVDPKGKMYQELADYAKDQGYVVKVLDLQDLSRSDGWDLLGTSLAGKTEEYAYTAAYTILRNCRQQDHASMAGYQMLAEQMIKQFSDKELSPEQKTIGVVYDKLYELIDSHEDQPQDQSFMFEPYGSQLKYKLSILKDEMMRKILSTNEIDLELPGKQKCMYFILPPEYMSRHMFIAPLFLEMLYAHLADYAEHQENGTLPVPVNFILDGFPWLGVLPDWEKKLAVCRRKNIRVSMTSVGFEILKRRYGDAVAEAIAGNCSTWLLLNLWDCDYEHLIGEYCEYNEVEDISHKIQQAQVDVDLVLILFAQHKPILMKKLYFEDHPDYKKLHK